MIDWTRDRVTEVAEKLEAEGKLSSFEALHNACCELDPNLPRPGADGSLKVTMSCFEIANNVTHKSMEKKRQLRRNQMRDPRQNPIPDLNVINSYGLPKWVQMWGDGLTDYPFYLQAFASGEKFGIIKRLGHTVYMDRGSGNSYSRVEYILVVKGLNYWSHRGTTLHEGRTKKKDIERMHQILAASEEAKEAVIIR